MVTPALQLHLLPDSSGAKAYYMLEAYAANADSGTMQVTVTDSTGRTIVGTRPAPVRLTASGSVLKGVLDLTGLPPGQYRMSVALSVGGSTESRSDEFTMEGLEQVALRQQGIAAMDVQSDAGYFAGMSDAELDAAESPLVYLTGSDSLAVWKSGGGLSTQAKREFLTQFWAQRDPTKGTPKNEFREQFYSLITQADRAYKEGGSVGGPGWKTDRGRIYIKYGKPADLLDRPTPSGKSPPYQVWRYARGKGQYYIFADRSGFGAYKLIATNDLRETQAPGFREILGADALQDVSRWLGIDLFRSSDEQQNLQ
jgi:GWxTD domain-containing protein